MAHHTKFILPAAAALLLSTSFAYAEDAAPVTEKPVAEKSVAEKPRVTRRALLENMDRNQDGAVDLSEVETFTTEQFNQIDDNKDGVITAEEMDTYHHSRRGKWKKEHDPSMAKASEISPEMKERIKAKADERRKKQFSNVDPGGDGKVTKEEFLNHAIARHKKMDLDGDSKVSKAEIRRLHEERKEKLKDHREKYEQRKSEGKMSKPPVKDAAKDAVKNDAPAAKPAE